MAHTADTGIAASADSLTDLLEELAGGMFELMAGSEQCQPTHRLTAQVSAASAEELVVDVLSELLYLAERDRLMLCDVVVEPTSPLSVEVHAGGLSADVVELAGAPIKAVTYHNLMVEQGPAGWSGRVYFDV